MVLPSISFSHFICLMIGIQSLSHGTGLSSSRTWNVQSRYVRHSCYLTAFFYHWFTFYYYLLLLHFASRLSLLLKSLFLSLCPLCLFDPNSLFSSPQISYPLISSHLLSSFDKPFRLGLSNALGCNRGWRGRRWSHEECHRHRISPCRWIRWHELYLDSSVNDLLHVKPNPAKVDDLNIVILRSKNALFIFIFYWFLFNCVCFSESYVVSIMRPVILGTF